jgi:hypothetical protein
MNLAAQVETTRQTQPDSILSTITILRTIRKYAQATMCALTTHSGPNVEAPFLTPCAKPAPGRTSISYEMRTKLFGKRGLVSKGYSKPTRRRKLVEKLNVAPPPKDMHFISTYVSLNLLTLWDEVDSCPLMQMLLQL